MPILDFHHLSHSDAALYLLAVILQPRDLEEQAGLFVRLQNSNTSIAMRKELCPAEWRIKQAARQLNGIDKRDSNRMIGANVAAEMLMRALAGKSLNSAVEEISKDYGKSTCWRYWDQFRPAVHLNAARRCSPELWHLDPPDLKGVLRAAEELRRRGESTRVTSRSGLLLDTAQMWRVPEELFSLL
jgi:hypothetical protein